MHEQQICVGWYTSSICMYVCMYVCAYACHLGWRTLVLRCNKNNYDWLCLYKHITCISQKFIHRRWTCISCFTLTLKNAPNVLCVCIYYLHTLKWIHTYIDTQSTYPLLQLPSWPWRVYVYLYIHIYKFMHTYMHLQLLSWPWRMQNVYVYMSEFVCVYIYI